MVTAEYILNFWFSEISPSSWWGENPELDAEIKRRFGSIYEAASACELSALRRSARGRLAEIIVLDQFSRNIWRNSGRAFATDALALALSQEAITAGAQRELSGDHKAFLYMPFMHSESSFIQARSVALFSEADVRDEYLEWAVAHKKVIDLFGRFARRNVALDRKSTPAELAFLSQQEKHF